MRTRVCDSQPELTEIAIDLKQQAKNPSARQLYTTAAITTGSGTVFAWTALRHINGALSIRSAKIAGPWTGVGSLPLTYSAKEQRSIDIEEQHSTPELVVKWKDYNLARSVILLVGTLIGAYTLAFTDS